MTPEQAAMQADVAWLDKGWDWLESHKDDPRYWAAENAWLIRLERYCQAYRIVFLGETS